MKGALPKVLLVALLLVSTGGMSAQEEGGGEQPSPGTFWNDLRPDQKAIFTLGYATGVNVFSQFAPGPCPECESTCLEDAKARMVPIGSGIPDVVAVLDSIYGDELNEHIPVMWAFKLAAEKEAGVSDQEWQDFMIEAREDSAPADAP